MSLLLLSKIVTPFSQPLLSNVFDSMQMECPEQRFTAPNIPSNEEKSAPTQIVSKHIEQLLCLNLPLTFHRSSNHPLVALWSSAKSNKSGIYQ